MITGSIVALVTPMHEDGSIDWESMDSLVDWHIESGTNGIVPVGTTGESATVDISEHCAIVKRVVKAVGGRVPVIAGTGANATSEAIELSLAAQNAGADACLLVTPYYNKPSQDGLYAHYKAVAEAVVGVASHHGQVGVARLDGLAEHRARGIVVVRLTVRGQRFREGVPG